MARANLGSLLSVANGSLQEDQQPPASVAAPEPATPAAAPVASAVEMPAAEGPPPPRKASAARAGRTPATPTPATSARWKDFERLEARLRDDQVAELDSLARRLNKQREGTGERITKNTLLRVATDLLLGQAGNATGSTEAEIRASLNP
jgi:hypothetical protein